MKPTGSFPLLLNQRQREKGTIRPGNLIEIARCAVRLYGQRTPRLTRVPISVGELPHSHGHGPPRLPVVWYGIAVGTLKGISTIHINNEDDRMSFTPARPSCGMCVINEMKDFQQISKQHLLNY